MAFKITYSVLSADMEEIHKDFDKALANARSSLGKEFPYWIGGQAKKSGSFLEDKNPANTEQILCRFHKTPPKEVAEAITIGKKAAKTWGLMPWQDRIRIIRAAADKISERRMEIAVLMSLEAGKNRMESLGDVEEAADLLRYYATQVEEARGFDRPMGQLSPQEKTRDILKPYGLFVVISPFNFPMALAAGMASGALCGGNAVILKPSQETPWSAQALYECFVESGLPAGVLQLVYGTGLELGQALTTDSRVDGIAFTGSLEVGMRIFHEFSKVYPKPCLMEMGGKNPAIICESADLEKAVTGCWKSAFGLTGQKCSALSRIFVHAALEKSFLNALVEKTKTTVLGDPTDRNVFVGPLINKSAVERHLGAIAEAKKSGTILVGGEDIRQQKNYSMGHFVAPTIARLKRDNRLFQEELFSPFVAVETFKTIEEAVELANSAQYGLTGGIFSQDKKEVEYFYDHMETGVLYSNRIAGATTGAWPGVQPFCGWKGSGATGKGGCGPYYVNQFMREQSQTRVE